MFDFKTIPNDLKNYLITSVSLPFWYVSVYYYFPSVYYQDDFLLTASVCLALSAISNFTSTLVVALDDESTDDSSPFDFHIVLAATIIQCLWLSILILIGYLTNKLFGCKFEYYGFLLTYFGGYILAIIIVSIFSSGSKKDKKNSSTKQ